MTTNSVPVDDADAARLLLSETTGLLLDFDGPVCSVFSGFPAPVVAGQLRETLAQGGHNRLPTEVQETDDPFDVFRYAASLGVKEARYVEAAMRAHEVEAMATAEPTIASHDLIRAWSKTGRSLAIVSNNSVASISSYLHLHELTDAVDVISARTDSDPDLLKPNPYLVEIAVSKLNLHATQCIFIGDSVADITAGLRSEVFPIGYA
ncbi:HAD family hydrolase, partial [Lentzea flaviverrucosa]